MAVPTGRTTHSQNGARNDEDTNREWVSPKALSNSHGRSFAESLEHFTRYAIGAELGVRSSVAADLIREWEAEDTRSENEWRAAERAAEKRDQAGSCASCSRTRTRHRESDGIHRVGPNGRPDSQCVSGRQGVLVSGP